MQNSSKSNCINMDISNCNKSSYGKHENANDIVSLVNDLLTKAVECSASDVHFEPTGAELAIKFRLDGVLSTIEKLPGTISDNVIARLKVLGGLLTYRNDIPQEGRIEITKNQGAKIMDQRLAVFPTIHGQRAVVRLFYNNAELMELDQLGFSKPLYTGLKNITAKNQGVLLLTGPAGSGKSTTLAALLRHILRQDPQVLMIGEIRDAETAKIAIEAGLTGHLLMSTMHSGSPAGALLRLLEMGIEPYQVTSSISAVLNQRLVRKLCRKCMQKVESTNSFKATGCDDCFNTGYKGRVLIAEMVQLDSQLRKAILAKADLDELENILKDRGHTTMLFDGKRLVNDGITTAEELNMVCGVLQDDSSAD